jgi:iron complex outermembrane receptor protein
MYKLFVPVCAFAATAVALGSMPAYAQDDDSIFEEITVTATKREQNIFDVPMAVSAFTEDMIFRQGITDLTDVGKFVPNMTVTGFSAGHVSTINVFLRGIGLQDHLITTDPGVGVYVDGVYLGRQVGQNWSLANIERVEVLRGPQGTLYGRNSIGGAINIITHPATKAEGARL